MAFSLTMAFDLNDFVERILVNQNGLVGRNDLAGYIGLFGRIGLVGVNSTISFIGLIGLVSIGLGRHNGVISLVGHICISSLVCFIGFVLISLVGLIGLSLINHYGLIGFIGLGISFMGLGISLIGLGGNNDDFNFIGLGIKEFISLVSLSGINGLIRRISLVSCLQLKIEMKPSQQDLFLEREWVVVCVESIFFSCWTQLSLLERITKCKIIISHQPSANDKILRHEGV
jgi:hypothetical protein